jgi:hypothetical protein
MNPASKLVARNMFKLRVHEAKGLAFQRLFEKVMTYRLPEFTPIRPYGNVGDRKNDGYIRSQGCYFQVFAPEDPTTGTTAVAAASKAAEDFLGLKEYWEKNTPIRTFRFVFNDEYRGSPPPLEEALAKIRSEYEVEASTFLAKDLEEEALLLQEDQLLDVIGTPIPETGPLDNVDFGVLREVIRHVLEKRTPLTSEATLRVPDFDDKIKFNGLSSSVANLLTFGSYQSDAIEDYFSRNSNFARQEVRDRLSSLYQDSRQRFSRFGYGAPNLGNVVFFDLLESITPDLPKAAQSNKAAAQEAAIVVMAYYFEACDIFEDPNAAP